MSGHKMKSYKVVVWASRSGAFVDSIRGFAVRQDAEETVHSLRAEDTAYGFPEIFRYEITEDGGAQ